MSTHDASSNEVVSNENTENVSNSHQDNDDGDGDDDVDAVLPFSKGSHNSAKIVIPEHNRDDNDDDDSDDHSATTNDEDDPFYPSTFRQRLEATIAACRELKHSSLWVQVPMSRAGLIEVMPDLGLEFHHAEGQVANLCLWLNEEHESKIPTYATHQVGVGAMVVNSRNEILCVRELRKNYRPWKVPGGLAELGEQLDEAIVREVLEETGVPCVFKSVLAVRHTHGLQFGRSDLYFMCRLEPIEKTVVIASDDEDGNGDNGNINLGSTHVMIPEPVPQEGEIETAAWVPWEEYIAMVNSEEFGHPMMRQMVELHEQDWATSDIQKTVVSSVVPGRKPSPIYHAPIRQNGTQEDSGS